jgi:hypothetical protein
MTESATIPNEAELRAYLQGTLSADRFAVVDAWLATQTSPEEVERLLLAAEPQPTALPQLRQSRETTDAFTIDGPRGRLTPGEELGAGGMGIVRAAHDRALQRTVALKVLRPRQLHEPLEAYLMREAAFRREAVMTANLEHPAIVPVYEIGSLGGYPAFSMKRLTGRSLEAIVREGVTPIAELVTILQRVAEAVAYAHHRGVVHRDLTPVNVLVGDYGAVYVLDWGLAERAGVSSSLRVGTPAWMAPEQHDPVPADPRMDVFGLGGLILFALTGVGPRTNTDSAHSLHLHLLDAPTVPAGLAAVAKRCLAILPAERYASGEAVADELARWQGEGLTLAQQVGWLHWWWLRLRRSAPVRYGTIAGCVATLVMAAGWWWITAVGVARAHTRVSELAQTVALDRPEALDLALSEVRSLRRDFPTLTDAAELESRLATAREVSRRLAEREQLREQINALLNRTRQIGPWVNQVTAWRAALHQVGLKLQNTTVDEDIAVLQHAGDALLIAEGLAFYWRCEREQGGKAAAEAAAVVLMRAGPTAGWRALGRILAHTEFRAHDPVLGSGSDADAVLAEPAPAATALSLFAPQRQLEEYARSRLEQAPGDFWALIAAGRAALAAHDVHESQHLALVASGAEPGSLLPRLILAYVALEQKAWPILLEQVERGLETDPANVELVTLRAIALAHLARRPEAERLVANLPAGHLRFHLAHRVGHPMELAVDALVATGIVIPEAPPDLGPLAPGHEHRH